MNEKILVADDDADVQEIIGMSLSGAGYQVVTASNGDEALEALKKEKLDLVILDVMMAQPDEGFYVAQKIRKMDQPVPIIMLTSVGQAIGWNYDADDEMVPVDVFLRKPVQPSVLLEKVKEVLASRGVEG